MESTAESQTDDGERPPKKEGVALGRHSYLRRLKALATLPRNDLEAEREPWGGRGQEWGPRVVFLVVLLLTWASLLLMLFPAVLWPPHAGRERHQQIDEHFGLVIAIASALPPVLAWLSYKLINKRALCERIQPSFPRDLSADSAPIVAVAEASWAYEMEKAHSSLVRAEVFAGVWGVMTSMSIVGSVIFLIPPFHTLEAPFEGAPSMVAFAMIGTTVTSFLLELARLSIRTSNDDATKRMFAESLRTLVLSIVTTMVLVLMAPVLGPDSLSAFLLEGKGSQATLAALGLGASIAIMGPPVFEWARSRLAALFGFEQKKAACGTPLDKLDDMGDAEIARLAEEGIQTVEALVNTPVPRLFLNTRFSLQRIVNWHDFGLLITRIGAGPATDLRVRWGVRGSVEIRRAVKDESEPAAARVFQGIFKKAMRVDGDPEAALVIRQIAMDDRVALAEVLRHTLLEKTLLRDRGNVGNHSKDGTRSAPREY